MGDRKGPDGCLRRRGLEHPLCQRRRMDQNLTETETIGQLAIEHESLGRRLRNAARVDRHESMDRSTALELRFNREGAVHDFQPLIHAG